MRTLPLSRRCRIEARGLAPLFDVVLIDGEFGAGKPDPKVFLHCLAALGAAPHEAWMVGDRLELDAAPARQLGIWSIWVDHAGTGLPDPSPVCPDRIILSVAALP